MNQHWTVEKYQRNDGLWTDIKGESVDLVPSASQHHLSTFSIFHHWWKMLKVLRWCHGAETMLWCWGRVPNLYFPLDGHTPLFSKGSGCGHIISDFLVQHPSEPFFSLSKQECDHAIRCYPDLLSDSIGLHYDGYSARARINVGEQGHFDNDTILCQFERLFQLFQFKEEYQGHNIEVVVDNARTHSAREYSIHNFGKCVVTKCPVDTIEFVDRQDHLVSVSCFFESGEHKGKSKGLLELTNNLQVPIYSSIKLSELRVLLLKHLAFQNVSKLEKLAHKYNVKVLSVPKFHCELNAIEGLWCYMKQLVREKTDQTKHFLPWCGWSLNLEGTYLANKFN